MARIRAFEWLLWFFISGKIRIVVFRDFVWG